MDLTLFAALAVVLLASIQTGDAVKCHVCNSGTQYEGPSCSNMENKTAFIKDCDLEGLMDGKNYTLCRKFHQDVEGDARIVRSCATSGRVGSCIDRTGTKSIKLKYCECAGDLCNGGSTVYGTILVSLSALVVAAITMM